MYSTSNRLKSKRIFAGMFIGFTVSIILVLSNHLYSQLANNIYVDVLIILLCTVIGLVIGLIYHSLNNPKKIEAIINLHREKLKISKRKVQTGEVTIRKEVIHELKNISIPIAKEVLVIENSRIDPSNGKNVKETIRIPYKEERVNIEKRAVQLEDISIIKKQFSEFQRYKGTLTEEKINVNVTGDIRVIDKEEN